MKSSIFNRYRDHYPRSRTLWIGSGALTLGAVLVGLALFLWTDRVASSTRLPAGASLDPGRVRVPEPPGGGPGEAVVTMDAEQQAIVGLRVEPVGSTEAAEVLRAPGQVVPDETRFAFITPRAAGVVRSVAGNIGQTVKAGDLLATIDSPEVAQARLELVARLQEREIAQAQADWQSAIYENTLALLERLKAGDTPEQIHERFAERPVGENRESLVRAYAALRLADARLTRNEELHEKGLITPKQYQEVLAEHEMAEATYQSLMDQMGFLTRLAYTRSRQALRQTETSVRAAQERLRVLGVKADGTEPEIRWGKVVGVQADGSLEPSADAEAATPTVEDVLPEARAEGPLPVKPAAAPPASPGGDKPEERTVSTYALWAPFDGIILDRERIVPGIYVNTTHAIYTLADLSSVWVEVHVPEGDFDLLAHSQGAAVELTARPYPGRTFPAAVIYAGDLVDEKTRTVKLLARADNPERLLKPGMFVNVEIAPTVTRRLAQVPRSALMIEGDDRFVYVRTGPARFERRGVVTGPADGDLVAITRGVEPGEPVVVEGAFKLKAKALRAGQGGADGEGGAGSEP